MIARITDNEEKDDTPEAQGWRQKTLKTAGLNFLFADAALFAYGVATKSSKFGLAAAFGWTEGFVGARYGNPTSEKQLEQVERQLGAYLRKQGVEIPKDLTTDSLTREGGIMDHVESFLYAYPTQIMNACYSMIGLQYLREGMHKKESDLLYAGGLLVAGALAGLLIPQKNPDPDNPPQGVVQKAISFVQENPLRLTGTLLTANLAFLAKNAFEERRNNPGKKSYMFKLAAVAGFALGNTLLALSSKSYGGGAHMDEDSLNQLAETSARVIAAQPLEMQEALMHHVAGFLASQPNVPINARMISEMLNKKMTEVRRDFPKYPQEGRFEDGRLYFPLLQTGTIRQ